MTEQTVTEQTDKDGGDVGITFLKRRGLLAAAWAAVAGIVAMRTSQPVEATSGGGLDGNMVLGSNFLNSNNTALEQTNIIPSGAAPFVGTVILDLDAAGGGGSAPNINGLYGHGKGTGGGVVGVTGGGLFSGGTFFPNAGVAGLSFGAADGGIGVLGQIPSGSTQNGIAVYGLNYSNYAGPGPGAGGFGVYGLSAKGHGLVGATAAAGAAAVVGATNGVAGAYAAAFYGSVIVGGAFTVVGGPKSAAVPHPDGSHRLLYCVESPESWFEDFGEGTLACGQAEVTLDPDFAAVADTEKYHVFITQYDEHNDLCVTQRTANGFRVQAKDEVSNGAFSWRVVAKRKDIVGERLAKITIPSEPQLPTPPTFHEATEPSPGFGRRVG